MSPSNPAADLERLLDALEQDLLAAPAADLADAQRATGRAWDTGTRAVRAILERAAAAADDPALPPALPPSAPAAKHWH